MTAYDITEFMQSRFTIYKQELPDGPVRYFCDGLLTHERGNEVVVETPSVLPPLSAETYCAQPQTSGETTEVWTVAFYPVPNQFQPSVYRHIYIGTFDRLVKTVPSEWVGD